MSELMFQVYSSVLSLKSVIYKEGVSCVTKESDDLTSPCLYLIQFSFVLQREFSLIF